VHAVLLGVPLVLAQEAASVPSSSLAAVGERVGEATIERIEAHPEYERYVLRLDGGDLLPAELTRADGVHQGLCQVEDLVLYPRLDMAEPGVDGGAAVGLCDRLRERTVSLRARGGQTPLAEGWVEAITVGRPARHLAEAIFVAAIVASLACLRRLRWEPFLAFAAAISLRLVASPRTLFNGDNAGFEKLVLALGQESRSPYGPAYEAWMRPWVAALGATPSTVFTANLVVSALAAPAAWALGTRVGGPRAGWFAALGTAMLPTHLALSRSEAMHVAAFTLAMIASWAAAEFIAAGRRAAAVAAVLSTVAAIHLRSDVLPFAAVPVIAIAGRSWRAGATVALTLAALVAPRFLGAGGATGILRLEAWRSAERWELLFKPRWGAPEPSDVFQLGLHAAFTPPVLLGLAVAGWFTLAWRARAWTLAWIGSAWPLAAKVFPLADAVRLQLVAQGAWVLLAALGASRLGWLGGVVLAGGMAPYLLSPVASYPQSREFQFLEQVVPVLAARERIAFDIAQPRAEKLRLVMEGLGPARWGVPDGVTLVYRGFSCAWPGSACPAAGCPEEVTRLTGPSDVDHPLPAGGIEIGFYRPSPCGSTPTASTGQDSTAN
jgi:hypothetical protein